MQRSAQELGWLLTLARLPVGASRRGRDALLSRRLHTSGFRAGRNPRILGIPAMKIGRNVHAADDLWLEAVTHSGAHRYTPELTLGDDVWMSDRVHIAALRSVEIGAGTLIGSGCLISDHGHGVYAGEQQSAPETVPWQRPLSSSGPIRIGRNVWLGDNVTVLAGAVIGDGAVVGAGTLVTGEIPAGSIAVGSPARIVRRWDAASAAWLRVPRDTID